MGVVRRGLWYGAVCLGVVVLGSGPGLAGATQTEGGDLWSFDGVAGDVVEILAGADGFDTTVELLSANGEVVGFNDDGGSGTNSRLVAVLVNSGRYMVRVGSYGEGASGAYEVAVRMIDVDDLTRDTPVEANLRGSQVESGAFWGFGGNAGQVVNVAARSSDFDTTIQLLSPTGDVVASNDDAGDGTDSEVSTVLPAGGRHVVRVAPYTGAGGGVYEVRWREIDVPPFEVEGVLPQVGSERGVFVNFDGTAGEIIAVVAKSVEFDTTAELVSPNGEVVAFNDDRGLDSHSGFLAVLSVTGRYRIRVASFDEGGSGSYELMVTRVDARALVPGTWRRGTF